MKMELAADAGVIPILWMSKASKAVALRNGWKLLEGGHLHRHGSPIIFVV